MSRKPWTLPVLLSLFLAVSPLWAQQGLSSDTRRSVIVAIAKELRAKYVFPEIGNRMAALVEERERSSAYSGIASAAQVAAALTTDLCSVSRDRHLVVRHRGASSAAPPVSGTSRDPVHLEILKGNIGYLFIPGFNESLSLGLPSLMKQLAGTDALIIDLRRNGGGSAEVMLDLAGYFFDEPKLVAKIYSRLDDATTELWTKPVKEPHYLEKAVFVLISNATFSAAEGFSYHMQQAGRVRIVGEQSGGGAHRVTLVKLPNEFSISVPYTRVMNTVTGTDWEGSGVTPNVAVRAERAKTAAHIEALRGLAVTPERSAIIKELSRELDDD